jgi:excisionase family DNA binding protein
MSAASPRVTLRDAAAQLGVHYQTAYRWVRQGVLPAVKVGRSYEVTVDAIAQVRQDRDTPSPPPLQRRVRDWEHFSNRFHRSLMSGDESDVRDLFADLLTGGVPLAEICDRVMVPALVRIGQDWSEGRISVAEEHRASSICERALGRWYSSPPGRPRGVAVVCSAPIDEHNLPGEMATAVLRNDHWRVHHLGTGVPAEDILGLVEAEAADVVVISVTWPPARPEAEAMAGMLSGDGRRVLIGQPGMTMADLLALVDAP